MMIYNKFFTALFSCRFDNVYDSMHNLCVTEDSIRPQKYVVEGYPPMNGFPAHHPNRGLQFNAQLVKDEL